MAQYVVAADAMALTAATAKTVLEISVPATADGWIKEWWCEFDGVTATAVPAKITLGRWSAVTTTGTAATPAKIRATTVPTSQMTCKTNVTVEGAGTASDAFGIVHRCPPTSGLWYVAPLGQEYGLIISTFWRMQVTAPAGVNCTAGVIWEE